MLFVAQRGVVVLRNQMDLLMLGLRLIRTGDGTLTGERFVSVFQCIRTYDLRLHIHPTFGHPEP